MSNPNTSSNKWVLWSEHQDAIDSSDKKTAAWKQLQVQLAKCSIMDVEAKFAGYLRNLAIKHLATSNEIVARTFRGEYVAAYQTAYESFLKEQAKNGAWGTYIEATAIGEALDKNVVVTPISHGKEQAPIVLHRAENPEAQTIYLFNHDNVHWSSVRSGGQTAADGNCLLNAIAQELKHIQELEAPTPLTIAAKQTAITKLSTTESLNTTTDNNTTRIIESQKAALQKYPTQTELKASFEAEQARIAALPPAEQKQIGDDHQLALRIAANELGQIPALLQPLTCAAEAELNAPANNPKGWKAPRPTF